MNIKHLANRPRCPHGLNGPCPTCGHPHHGQAPDRCQKHGERLSVTADCVRCADLPGLLDELPPKLRLIRGGGHDG